MGLIAGVGFRGDCGGGRSDGAEAPPRRAPRLPRALRRVPPARQPLGTPGVRPGGGEDRRDAAAQRGTGPGAALRPGAANRGVRTARRDRRAGPGRPDRRRARRRNRPLGGHGNGDAPRRARHRARGDAAGPSGGPRRVPLRRGAGRLLPRVAGEDPARGEGGAQGRRQSRVRSRPRRSARSTRPCSAAPRMASVGSWGPWARQSTASPAPAPGRESGEQLATAT